MTLRKIWLSKSLDFPETFTKTFTLRIPEGRSRLGYNVICPVHGKSSTFTACKGASNVRAAVTLKSNKKFLATLAEGSRYFEGSYNHN